MSEGEKQLLKFYEGALAFIVGFPVGLLRGYVASLFWGWFVVPVTGWRPVSILEALGIVYAAALISPYSFCKAAEQSAWVRLVMGIILTFLWWFFGWLLHMLIGVFG